MSLQEEVDVQWLLRKCYPRGMSINDRIADVPNMLEGIDRLHHRSEEFKEAMRQGVYVRWY